MRKRKYDLGLKTYTEQFTHEGKTWHVIHKTSELKYAVEVDQKGVGGGGVKKFPC